MEKKIHLTWKNISAWDELESIKTSSEMKGTSQREKMGTKGYVEADHIPPMDSLRRAESYPEFSTLHIRNPVLHHMVISLRRAKQCKGTDLYEGTDPYGKNLLAIQVATEHHRTALSTVSKAARGVVAQRIASGDVKTMLKQAMIIAHPFASQMIREYAGWCFQTTTSC
ncbi:hypothetical protein CRUP_017297, partial [Coryphaenoides rupestris]